MKGIFVMISLLGGAAVSLLLLWEAANGKNGKLAKAGLFGAAVLFILMVSLVIDAGKLYQGETLLKLFQ